MSAQFRRVGALRTALIIGLSAAAATIALSLSGLTPDGRERPFMTVTQPLPNSPRATPRRATPHKAVQRQRRSALTPQTRCRPVDGIAFAVSAGTPCPQRLRRRSVSRLSPQQRAAARRPRPAPAATSPDVAKSPPASSSPSIPHPPDATINQPPATPAPPPPRETEGPGGAAGPANPPSE